MKVESILSIILLVFGSLFISFFFILPNIIIFLPEDNYDLAKPKMKLIESNLQRFYIDCGRFPTESEGLEALLYSPTDLEGAWNGPYLKKDNLLDPWKNPYIYSIYPDPNSRGYNIISYGADGLPGGEGYNTDIYNHD